MFKSIFESPTVALRYIPAEFRLDRSGKSIMTVARDPIWRHAGCTEMDIT
jgi:hypothetical protein